MLYTVSQVLYQILFVPAVASTDLGGNGCFFRIGLPVGFFVHPALAFHYPADHHGSHGIPGRVQAGGHGVNQVTDGHDDGECFLGEANFDIRMYMDILDEENIQICQHTYTGRITHYGALTNMVFQNYNVRLEQYMISVPSPYIDGEQKWALAFGISSHPLMPTSAKLLLSKKRLKKTKELAQKLTISKEDIRLLKLYNLFVVL